MIYMKICPNCGSLNNNESLFCLHCGNNLIQNNNTINNNLESQNNVNTNNLNSIDSTIQADNTTQNLVSTDENSLSQNPKKYNKKLVIIIIAIIMVILVVGLFIMINHKKRNSKQYKEFNNNLTEKLENPKTFVISLPNGLNAMFDENGEQYTDFIYSSLYGNNGVYKAEQKDNKKIQILGNKGNVIFEPSDNVNVDLHMGYFFVKEKGKDTGELFNKEGKVILTGVTGVFSDSIFPKFLLYLKDNKYYGLNTKLDEVFYLEKSEDETQYPIVDYNYKLGNDIMIKFFKERLDISEIYIFDTEKEEQIMKLNVSPEYKYETHFGDNYEKVIFTSYDNYILYENGIKKYEKSQDDYGVECEFEFLEDGTLICSGNTSYFVNDDGSIRTENPLLNVEFIDKDNYATYDDDLKTTTIYSNGVPTTYKCWESPKSSNDIYLLNNYPYGECNFYGVNYSMVVKKDGTKIIENPTIEIVSDGNFAVITSKILDDFSVEFTSEFYDSNGNKIKLPISQDEELSLVTLYNEDIMLLKVRNANKGLRDVLLDKNGKILLEDKNIVYLDLDEINRIYTYEKNGEYKIYNSETFKYITTVDSEPQFMHEYFITKDNDYINYYSYITGKKFYSYKR